MIIACDFENAVPKITQMDVGQFAGKFCCSIRLLEDNWGFYLWHDGIWRPRAWWDYDPDIVKICGWFDTEYEIKQLLDKIRNENVSYNEKHKHTWEIRCIDTDYPDEFCKVCDMSYRDYVKLKLKDE